MRVMIRRKQMLNKHVWNEQQHTTIDFIVHQVARIDTAGASELRFTAAAQNMKSWITISGIAAAVAATTSSIKGVSPHIKPFP